MRYAGCSDPEGPLGQNPNPTSESSWTGALSSWGVALQKTGNYTLDTLTSGSTITYGTSPFGLSVDTLSISSDHPKAISDATNPVLNGSFGKVTGSLIASGTTFTLKPADNSAVKGLLWRTGYSSSGTTGAFFATSTFGSGRVAVWGDSSPIDDGTGQPGNTLYDGWNDSSATNAAVALNATEWLFGATGTGGGGGGGTCTAAQLLGNPGFESGSSVWSATSGVITNSSGEPAQSGSYKAWLGGKGAAHTDTLSQSVTIPSGCAATLGFALHIDTAETTTSTAYDTLKAQVVNGSGTVLSTLAGYSNLNAVGGYTQRSFDLSAYAGQTVTIKSTGIEGSKLQTSFVIDDTALNVS
ncbi:hypothetical protein QMK19_15995 [Streptomyces sp. H10-C2]|uniref:hypothetical protein n=1 Tax=unclassified Streptomyces TaxID=2593676 RepID=UPI0024B8E8CC|nr:MULTISPECIES: hypothetical protein [unclassified Streptomyces]MDJ0346197.1 hypothetical protein [Streptomyces sp. PH10-H1]MDJ0371148.1 hypothetical protein [Streptomyces sp. H10-C2]